MSSPAFLNDSFPMVELVKQEALAVEPTIINGRQQYVHVVVKNAPFNIQLRSVLNNPSISPINFQQTTIQAQLYYDCDPPKVVDYIHHEPMQYVSVVSTTGNEISVEVKIGILSSQHQGALFIVMLRIVDSLTNETLCVLSHPIRVVSKIDHIRKEGVPIKKKTFNEVLTDKLRDLEHLQSEHTHIIKAMYTLNHIPFDGIKPEPTSPDSLRSPKDIQLCFNNVVATFKNTTTEERPEKVRRIVSEMKLDDLDQLVDAFGNDLQDFRPSIIKNGNGDCKCANCPARKELENFNNFQTNFLGGNQIETMNQRVPTTPISNPMMTLPTLSPPPIMELPVLRPDTIQGAQIVPSLEKEVPYQQLSPLDDDLVPSQYDPFQFLEK